MCEIITRRNHMPHAVLVLLQVPGECGLLPEVTGVAYL